MRVHWSLLILALLLSTHSAHAFNKDRCGRLFPQADGDHPPYYSPIYVSTMIPSTTSYFSSFGPCGMYADGQGIRSAFLEKMLPEIQADAARGGGQYVEAFGTLSGCSADGGRAFGSVMQRHFESVFLQPHARTREILQRVDDLLRTEPSLNKSCLGS